MNNTTSDFEKLNLYIKDLESSNEQLTKDNSWLNVRLKQVEDINKEVTLKKNQATAVLKECFMTLTNGPFNHPYHMDITKQIIRLLVAHKEASPDWVRDIEASEGRNQSLPKDPVNCEDARRVSEMEWKGENQSGTEVASCLPKDLLKQHQSLPKDLFKQPQSRFEQYVEIWMAYFKQCDELEAKQYRPGTYALAAKSTLDLVPKPRDESEWQGAKLEALRRLRGK